MEIICQKKDMLTKDKLVKTKQHKLLKMFMCRLRHISLKILWKRSESAILLKKNIGLKMQNISATK